MASSTSDGSKANAVMEKLCPHHFPYISRCFACRSFLHKVSKELFSQESEKTKALAETAQLQKIINGQQSSILQKDTEIEKLYKEIDDLKAVHFLPESQTTWQVHALAGRLNRRLTVTTALLKTEPDCAVDIDGFDAQSLAKRMKTTIKNEYYKPKSNPENLDTKSIDFKIPKKVYQPCGTEQLFSERATSVTATLGISSHNNHGRGKHNCPGHRFKRGTNRHRNFNEDQMKRFLDKYMEFKSNNNTDDDNQSVVTYTSEDQANSNITLPMSDKGKKSTTAESQTKHLKMDRVRTVTESMEPEPEPEQETGDMGQQQMEETE